MCAQKMPAIPNIQRYLKPQFVHIDGNWGGGREALLISREQTERKPSQVNSRAFFTIEKQKIKRDSSENPRASTQRFFEKKGES